MKKVGIITYHRAYNYGSALQSYALNYFLRTYGFDVKTIDYSNENQRNLYELFEKNNSVMSIARNIHTLLYYGKLKEKKRKFDEFIKLEIPVTEKKFMKKTDLINYDFGFDNYICGSDQIWNQNCADFDSSYMLSFVKDKTKCISYAPSIGVSSITDEQGNKFKEEISNFKSISIREEQGKNILEKYIDKDIKVVLDPTFLIEENEWEKLSNKPKIKGDYIFAYFIGDVSGMRDFTESLRKKTKLPVVVVYKNLRDFKYKTVKYYDAGPKEFLGLIKNAKYVCTNSFHSVVFSIIFKKKFWVFVEDQDKNLPQTRIHNITKKLGLENRILSKSKMDIDIDANIDYEEVNKKLNEEKQKSIKYLLDSME